MMQELSCSTARGIFPYQASSPGLLHWQADSLPLSHRRSPNFNFFPLNSFVNNILSNSTVKQSCKIARGWVAFVTGLFVFFSERTPHFILRRGRATPKPSACYWATMPMWSWTSSRPPSCMLQFTIRERRWSSRPSGTKGTLPSCPQLSSVLWRQG